jgi:hypothetical protein
MAQEDLDSLGFSADARVVAGVEKAADDGEEIIAGLSSAKKKQGVLLGIGSGAKRGGGHG